MPTQPRSRCSQCGSRRGCDCARKSKARRNRQRALHARIIAEHVELHGWVCPGYRRPAHDADHLTVDDIVPISKGGTEHRSNKQVLCVECNSAKGDR